MGWQLGWEWHSFPLEHLDIPEDVPEKADVMMLAIFVAVGTAAIVVAAESVEGSQDEDMLGMTDSETPWDSQVVGDGFAVD